MNTKEELQALDSKQLNTRLDELSEQLDDKLPKNGTNEEKVERILTAQEMLELKLKGESGEGGDEPDPIPDANPDQDNISPDPDADKPEDPTPATGKKYFVSAVPENGFFRCSLFFPHEGREVELTDDQLTRIKAEKNLVLKD